MGNFPNNFLRQKCCYWAPTGPDGYGGQELADPIELSCRWAGSTEVLSDGKGQQFVSRAVVMVSQDVQELGYLWLGELVDLDSGQDPLSLDGCFQIKRFDKNPTVKATAYVRAAFL